MFLLTRENLMKDKNYRGKRSHTAQKRPWLREMFPELYPGSGKKSARKKRKQKERAEKLKHNNQVFEVRGNFLVGELDDKK